VNVARQQEQASSLLLFYQRLIQFREQEPALYAGDFVPVYRDHQMMSYMRQLEGYTRFLVVLNLSHRPCYFRSPSQDFRGTIEICTAPELEGQNVSGTIALEGDQGIVVRLE
jgi:alpha-glucosidase